MDNVGQPDEGQVFQSEVERHFHWNFGVSVLEGALFWLGVNFTAPATIMPLYVSHLTESRVLIGLISAITGAGWYLPQLFTANYVERLPVKKKMVVSVGFFTERLPFLIMAASVFLFAASSPHVALLLFFITLAWHNLGAGIIAIAWQDMMAKIIPVNYRGRVFGIATFAGTATGVVGAALAAQILAHYTFPTSFGLCMLLTFLFVLISWVALLLMREPPLRSHKPTISLHEYLRRLPPVLHSDHNFAAYLMSRVMAVFGKMGIGFVTVYAVQRWQLTDSQAGLYTTVLLVGQAVANLVAGILADRYGHKLVLEISLILLALSMFIADLAPSPVWMYLVFAAIGALLAADLLSGIMIAMEFTGSDERPTYMGLANTIPGLFATIAPVLGGWVASRASYGGLFLTTALLSLLAWAVLRWMVKEPRASSP